MNNNVIKLIGLMLSTTLLFAVGGTTNIQKAGSHVGQHYAEFGSTGEADALAGPIVLTTQFNRNFSRDDHGTDEDRKSVVQGKSVDLGGRRIIKKTTKA